MKKRRSTVLVRPGKDVTLYIPSDTAPEVINYLNRLKREGIFSQGVMDMITRYVREERLSPNAAREDTPEYSLTDTAPEVLFESDRKMEQDESGEHRGDNRTPEDSIKLNMAQIFRQARNNSGKLLNESEKK